MQRADPKLRASGTLQRTGGEKEQLPFECRLGSAAVGNKDKMYGGLLISFPDIICDAIVLSESICHRTWSFLLWLASQNLPEPLELSGAKDCEEVFEYAKTWLQKYTLLPDEVACLGVALAFSRTVSEECSLPATPARDRTVDHTTSSGQISTATTDLESESTVKKLDEWLKFYAQLGRD